MRPSPSVRSLPPDRGAVVGESGSVTRSPRPAGRSGVQDASRSWVRSRHGSSLPAWVSPPMTASASPSATCTVPRAGGRPCDQIIIRVAAVLQAHPRAGARGNHPGEAPGHWAGDGDVPPARRPIIYPGGTARDPAGVRRGRLLEWSPAVATTRDDHGGARAPAGDGRRCSGWRADVTTRRSTPERAGGSRGHPRWDRGRRAACSGGCGARRGASRRWRELAEMAVDAVTRRGCCAAGGCPHAQSYPHGRGARSVLPGHGRGGVRRDDHAAGVRQPRDGHLRGRPAATARRRVGVARPDARRRGHRRGRLGGADRAAGGPRRGSRLAGRPGRAIGEVLPGLRLRHRRGVLAAVLREGRGLGIDRGPRRGPRDA
jgi:hypothetical protein